MKILRTNEELKNWLTKNKNPAFVPTMGFLHQAHVELMKRAKNTQNKVLVSLFVNPKQFRPGEDLDTYPRNEGNDIKICEENNIDAVFIPEPQEIYPENFSIQLPSLPKKFSILEGELRPKYFEGIATVLIVLFEKINPKSVHFGYKDYQQQLLVKWLVQEKKYNISVDIAPIFRAKDGLALSSRNAYLNEKERKEAHNIYLSLESVQKKFNEGERNVQILKNFLQEKLHKSHLTSQIDICEILDAKSLEKISVIEKKAVVLLYVQVGIPRLLDNCILDPEKNTKLL